MPSDFIPRPDAQFDSWQINFVTYLAANLGGLGLVAGDITATTTAQTAWIANYAAHNAAQAAAIAARANKDGARAAFEVAIRPLVRRLQASSAVSDPERASLGITIPDPTSTPAPIPTTKPVAQVDTSQRLRHTIAFSDEATPTSKAKPAGVNGAEIWVKVGGAAPTDPSELDFLALDTKSPYLSEYAGAQGNMVAHYMLRWVNTRGQKGPWSETVSATIGA